MRFAICCAACSVWLLWPIGVDENAKWSYDMDHGFDAALRYDIPLFDLWNCRRRMDAQEHAQG